MEEGGREGECRLGRDRKDGASQAEQREGREQVSRMGDEDADDALEAVIMRESGTLGDCGC